MCSETNCPNPIKQGGLCNAHYHKWYRGYKNTFDTNDFWEFVKKELKLGEAK